MIIYNGRKNYRYIETKKVEENRKVSATSIIIVGKAIAKERMKQREKIRIDSAINYVKKIGVYQLL